MARSHTLEDIFEVLEVDPDGKKFDKVSRIVAKSDLYELDLVLDVATSVYPVARGDKLALCLSGTLNADGTPSAPSYGAELLRPGKPSLADAYDYVVHGRVFKYAAAGGGGGGGGGAKAAMYASFGGLLMQLTGDPKRFEAYDVDMNVFLLARKV